LTARRNTMAVCKKKICEKCSFAILVIIRLLMKWAKILAEEKVRKCRICGKRLLHLRKRDETLPLFLDVMHSLSMIYRSMQSGCFRKSPILFRHLPVLRRCKMLIISVLFKKSPQIIWNRTFKILHLRK
jgi:hypothetical protein